MNSIQLKDTLSYPVASDNVGKRLLVGATITVLGIFLFPFMISLGYYTRSLTDTILDKDSPPELSKSELLPLFMTGSGVLVIIIGYLILSFLSSIFAVSLIGVITTGKFIAGNIAAHMTAFFFIMGVCGLLTAYVLPISVARYGLSGSILEAFRVSAIVDAVTEPTYFIAMLFSIVLSVGIMIVIAVSGLIPPVGVVLALCSKFPSILLISRSHGNGLQGNGLQGVKKSATTD